MVAEKLDKLDLMESDLKRVLTREPDNVDALNALGYTLADRTRRYDEATDYIQRAQQLRPDSHYVHDSKGWKQYRQGAAPRARSESCLRDRRPPHRGAVGDGGQAGRAQRVEAGARRVARQ